MQFDVCTDCAYTRNVGFEWDDDSKAGINFRKHGVRMPEAVPVFDDPFAITITDDEPDPGEQRFVTLGMGVLAWVFLMQPYAHDASLSLAERGVSIAYPLMDVLLLA